uniref:Uncharacterized protein LOC114336107 isoform X1 n=1 Tax=Diabrotica virgifera virgifera TaxID=50390 RepID=A0A6P7GDI5_DIAVI
MAAAEALGERKISKHIRKKRRTPWFCEEIKIKCQEKKKIYLEYKSKRTRQTYEEYKRVRNELNSIVRRKKTEHWEAFSKEMEHDFYGMQVENDKRSKSRD